MTGSHGTEDVWGSRLLRKGGCRGGRGTICRRGGFCVVEGFRAAKVSAWQSICVMVVSGYGGFCVVRRFHAAKVSAGQSICVMVVSGCGGFCVMVRFHAAKVSAGQSICVTIVPGYGGYYVVVGFHATAAKQSAASRGNPQAGNWRKPDLQLRGIPIYSCGKSRFLLTGRPVSCIITLLYITVIWRMEWKKNHRIP